MRCKLDEDHRRNHNLCEELRKQRAFLLSKNTISPEKDGENDNEPKAQDRFDHNKINRTHQYANTSEAERAISRPNELLAKYALSATTYVIESIVF